MISPASFMEPTSASSLDTTREAYSAPNVIGIDNNRPKQFYNIVLVSQNIVYKFLKKWRLNWEIKEIFKIN